MFDNIFVVGCIFILLAFLSGSIPYGYIYAKFRGVDIRKVGSGNIGTTNVGRQFGFWQGFVPIFLLDFLKGFLPILVFNNIVFVDHLNLPLFSAFQIFIGIMAVLGHMFTPFLKFKGGKGVATAAGIVTAWNGQVFISCLVIFLFVFFTFGKKIIGRASLVTSAFLPFVTLIFSDNIFFKVISFIISFLIISLHKKNIKDWISGQDIISKQAKNEPREI